MPVLSCRHCGKLIHYEKISDAAHFPFCCERCKLLDLGAWLDEEHCIPTREDPPAEPQQGQ